MTGRWQRSDRPASPFALSLSKGPCARWGFDKLSPNGGVWTGLGADPVRPELVEGQMCNGEASTGSARTAVCEPVLAQTPFALSLSKGPCARRGFDKLSPNGGVWTGLGAEPRSPWACRRADVRGEGSTSSARTAVCEPVLAQTPFALSLSKGPCARWGFDKLSPNGALRNRSHACHCRIGSSKA